MHCAALGRQPMRGRVMLSGLGLHDDPDRNGGVAVDELSQRVVQLGVLDRTQRGVVAPCRVRSLNGPGRRRRCYSGSRRMTAGPPPAPVAEPGVCPSPDGASGPDGPDVRRAGPRRAGPNSGFLAVPRLLDAARPAPSARPDGRLSRGQTRRAGAVWSGAPRERYQGCREARAGTPGVDCPDAFGCRVSRCRSCCRPRMRWRKRHDPPTAPTYRKLGTRVTLR